MFQVEEAVSKSKKKKLKKKRKKQRELLEQQLKEMEGLSVDPDAMETGCAAEAGSTGEDSAAEHDVDMKETDGKVKNVADPSPELGRMRQDGVNLGLMLGQLMQKGSISAGHWGKRGKMGSISAGYWAK